MARRHVTVALSGDGGDELFGGYDSYAAERLQNIMGRFVPPQRQRQFQRWLRGVAPTGRKKGLINKMKRFSEGAEYPPGIHHYRWMSFLTDDVRSRLYTPRMRQALHPGSAFDGLVRHFSDASTAPDDLSALMYVDLKVYLPEDILPKVDVASMANSLEVRVPFLDREVIDLACAIPARMKMRGLQRKMILRAAFQDLLPASILSRKKEGFSIPMKNWLKNQLKDAMFDVLTPRAIAQTGWFEWPAVNRMIMEHLKGSENHAHLLWSLMVLHLWIDKFYRRAPSLATEACDATVGAR